MLFKIRIAWIALTIVAVSIGAAVLALFVHGDANPATRITDVPELAGVVAERGRRENEPSSSRRQSRQVTVIHPTPGGGSRTTTQPASVHAFGIVDLFAKVSGYLKNQRVDIGDHVREGEELAEVDAPEIIAAAARAAAMLEKAVASVNQSQATLSARQADEKAALAKLEQTKADLKSYQADVRFRILQYNRIKTLADLNSIRRELVDEQAQQLEVAKSKLAAGGKAVDTSEAQRFAAEAAIKQAEASLADAKAQVRIAQADLDGAAKRRVYPR